ncbi:MAG: hypothetical protein AB7Q81_24565 [Gammaproteobacteria bacterium]
MVECQGLHFDDAGEPRTCVVLQPTTRNGVARFLRWYRRCGFLGD